MLVRRTLLTLVTGSLLITLVGCATGSTWPQFRGPGGAGLAPTANQPLHWSDTDNVAWVTEIPGRGWSSPVLWGDRIFLTSAISEGIFKEPSTGIFGNDDIERLMKEGKTMQEAADEVLKRDIEKADELQDKVVRRMVYCVNAHTGKILWEREAHRGLPPGGRHRKNTYASATPVTDGERVYAYYGNCGLFCYDYDGKQLWSKTWDSVQIYLDFGTGASPILHGDRIYLVNDNNDQSFVAAIDKYTGEEVWRTDRQTLSSWVTPCIWENDLRTELVTADSRMVVSYDLDGHELWRMSGLGGAGAPTPVVANGILYVSSGHPQLPRRPLFAIKPGAAGDISLKEDEDANDYVAWINRKAGTYIPSPLVCNGHVYSLFDKGFLGVYDASTGEELHKQRIGEGGVAFSASPWSAGPYVYCLSEDGDTYVFDTAHDNRLLATNPLNEMSLASPALADGCTFIRTATKLYRIETADRS